MRPVLFDLGGLPIQAYGVSKALAALVAGWMLARGLRRVGRDPELAYGVVIAAMVGGFAGAKLYYLLEVGSSVSLHDLGGTGFTWYGGLLGGAGAVAFVARRQGIPIGMLSGLVAAPLAVGYAIGRLGCLLAGDGTYGSRSDLPWAMSFPHGTVPTLERVHPTPLYEALAAFAIAAILWRLGDRLTPVARFGVFAVLMGAERFLVEFVRINDKLVVGLTAAQLWSVGLSALGAALVVRERSRAMSSGQPVASAGATTTL